MERINLLNFQSRTITIFVCFLLSIVIGLINAYLSIDIKIGLLATNFILIFFLIYSKRNLTISYLELFFMNLFLFIPFYLFIIIAGLNTSHLAYNFQNTYYVLMNYNQYYFLKSPINYLDNGLLLLLMIFTTCIFGLLTKGAIRNRMKKMVKYNDIYISREEEKYFIYTISPDIQGYPIQQKHYDISKACELQMQGSNLAYLKIPEDFIEENKIIFPDSESNYFIQDGFLNIPLSGNGDTDTDLTNNHVRLYVHDNNNVLKLKVSFITEIGDLQNNSNNPLVTKLSFALKIFLFGLNMLIILLFTPIFGFSKTNIRIIIIALFAILIIYITSKAFRYIYLDDNQIIIKYYFPFTKIELKYLRTILKYSDIIEFRIVPDMKFKGYIAYYNDSNNKNSNFYSIQLYDNYYKSYLYIMERLGPSQYIPENLDFVKQYDAYLQNPWWKKISLKVLLFSIIDLIIISVSIGIMVHHYFM